MEKRHQHDVNIQPRRPVVHIIKIVPQPFFETGVAAPAVDLRVSRETAANGMAHVVLNLLLSKFACELRPLGARSDKTHIAAQDVPQLRQFIEAVTAKVVTDSGAPWIGRYRPDWAEIPLGMLVHGSELDDREAEAIQADSRLAIKDRATSAHSHGQRNEGEQWRKQNETGGSSRYVDEAFQEAGKSSKGFMRAGARGCKLPIFFRSTR